LNFINDLGDAVAMKAFEFSNRGSDAVQVFNPLLRMGDDGRAEQQDLLRPFIESLPYAQIIPDISIACSCG